MSSYLKIGLRIGRVVLLEKINSTQWKICCDCGTEKVILRSNLYRIQSCGCLRNERCAQTGRFNRKYESIKIGEVINSWTVLSKGSYQNNQQRWLCRCECGVEKEVAQQHLRNGKSKHCIKCGNQVCSQRASEKNFGLYKSGNRRLKYVQKVIKSLYEVQKGLCSLCGKQLPQDLSKCAWDHDHVTGEGRDLLHKGCNVFLGFIERDPKILDRVKQYCKRYKTNI